MTRVTQLIHDAGKYLLISVYPLPTHPTHNFTHNNGGNLETLPGWPKKLQHNRSAGQWLPPYQSLVGFCLVIWDAVNIFVQHHIKRQCTFMYTRAHVEYIYFSPASYNHTIYVYPCIRTLYTKFLRYHTNRQNWYSRTSTVKTTIYARVCCVLFRVSSIIFDCGVFCFTFII